MKLVGNTSNFHVLYLNVSLPSMTDAPAPSFFVTVPCDVERGFAGASVLRKLIDITYSNLSFKDSCNA